MLRAACPYDPSRDSLGASTDLIHYELGGATPRRVCPFNPSTGKHLARQRHRRRSVKGWRRCSG